MRSPRFLLLAAGSVIACAAIVLPVTAAAQDSTAVQAPQRVATSPVFDSRDELRDRRQRLEAQLSAAGLASQARDSLQRRLARVERRLSRGDFTPGNIVEIRVPGYDTISGRFQVTPERSLEVPTLEPLDLSGVLFAEADSVIGGWLRQYVRADRIRIRVLQRVAVLGQVGDPGFYDLSPATPLSVAVMAAGGPTQNSALDEIEIRRDGRTIASAKERPIDESASLEELGLERGDQIFVPAESAGFGVGSVISVIGAIGTLSFALTRIF